MSRDGFLLGLPAQVASATDLFVSVEATVSLQALQPIIKADTSIWIERVFFSYLDH